MAAGSERRSDAVDRPGVRELILEAQSSPWLARQLLRAVVFGGIHTTVVRLQGVSLGRGAVFFGRPIVQRYRGSKIAIGARFECRNYAASNAVGCSHPVILSTRNADSEIVIGDDVGITGGVVSATESVVIGHGSLIGADCVIVDSDFHPIDPVGRRYRRDGIGSAPVTIGPNVFLGIGSVVLKGVSIGQNSIIGARSVVTESIPPNVIAAGNPARPVAELG